MFTFPLIQPVRIGLALRLIHTVNLLRPATDSCEIEFFPMIRPCPLRQSQRPATSVNEPLPR